MVIVAYVAGYSVVHEEKVKSGRVENTVFTVAVPLLVWRRP